ncbi:hypothetical protein BDW62DRAFT_201058 [Aspergillus aurantiobrunneus]
MSRPTEELEDMLAKRAGKFLKVHNALQILQVLLGFRGVRPATRHYKSLIQCNVDPQHGSSVMVRHLLREMEEYEVPTDSTTLHAALQALAVHPDYVLRQDVLRALRDRWLPVSPDGWHYVVAGLIREHQFELALDHIAHMERKDIVVQEWLHSLLIYYLCEFKEFDPILELMDSRLSRGYDVTKQLWTHVLTAATHSYHHGLTRFIWDRIVARGVTPPDRRLCTRILKVAGRTGDTELTTSVKQMLRHHQSTLSRHEYERLCEARIKSGDMYGAFETLCEMQEARHTGGVQRMSTQPILTDCLQKKTPARDVWNILKDLKSAGKNIPLACARVVFELCENAAVDDPFAVDDGVSFYKELHALCDRKFELPTFNALIQMCRAGNNADSALFFVKEMAALGIVPDRTTFENLIIMCLNTGNFESAHRYLEDLSKRDIRMSHKARATMRGICAQSSDASALKVKSHPALQKSRHAPSDKVQQRKKEKRRAYAIAKTQEEQGWEDYEPSVSTPEDLLDKADKIMVATAEAKKK